MRKSQRLPLSFGWTWFSDTWVLFSKARGLIFGLALLSGFLTLVVAVIPVLGKIASGFFYPLIVGGGMRVLGAIDEGRPAQVSDFFAPISESALFKKYLPLSLVCGALMLATAIISGVLVLGLGMNSGLFTQNTPIPGLPNQLTGTVLVTLVGVLVTLTMSVVMAIICVYGPALIELEGASAKEAMEQSLVLTTRNWLPLFILGFVYMAPVFALLLPAAITGILAMTGALHWAISIGLALIGGLASVTLMIPISFCLPYIIYKDTFRPSEMAPDPSK